MKTTLCLLTLLATMTGFVSAQPAPEVEALHGAAHDGDLETVSRLLEAGIAVDLRDPGERTPLMWAGFNGHTPVVLQLLENGAAVDAKDTNGRTALMYAASGPFVETVEVLLDKGAEVNAQDTLEGFTALMTAAAEGQLEVVTLLLARGADPVLEDVDGDTAASFAEQNGHPAVFDLLRSPPPPAKKP
jgi:ankyrin repeat protein